MAGVSSDSYEDGCKCTMDMNLSLSRLASVRPESIIYRSTDAPLSNDYNLI
jgi:hypothetical protein